MIPIPNLPKWAYGAIAVVAGIGLFLVWNHFDNRAAVNADRAKTEAEVTRKELKAEQEATRLERYREAKRKREEAELRETVREAERNNPDETNKPAGPAVRSVLDSLRSQAGKDSNPAA